MNEVVWLVLILSTLEFNTLLRVRILIAPAAVCMPLGLQPARRRQICALSAFIATEVLHSLHPGKEELTKKEPAGLGRALFYRGSMRNQYFEMASTCAAVRNESIPIPPRLVVMAPWMAAAVLPRLLAPWQPLQY